MSQTAERVAPHSLNAEAALLGAILVQGDRILDAAPLVNVGDFFRQAHGHVFAAMRDLGTAGQGVDALTVAELLKQRGQLEGVGGHAYLFGLTDGLPGGTNVAAYAGIVRDHAQKRRLMAAAARILEDSARAEKDAKALVDDAERLIFGVSEADCARGEFSDAKALAEACYAELQELAEGGAPVGVLTGFADFDHMTQGLKPGALILIAARPSMGKSAFALNVAWHAAKHAQTVGFYSLEMSKSEIGKRLVSSISGVDSQDIQRGRFAGADDVKIGQALAALSGSRLHVDDTANLSAFDVRGKARRLKAQHGLDLVIVDYLQLMQAGDAENRNIAIAEMSRSLKLLARELGIPVVALSQLSRETERRGDKKPMLSDLRDSGALEQDADLVAFIHRAEVYQQTPDNAGIAELIIAKQRNGPTGLVRLRWTKETTRFDNLSER
jgi:replicative DNA helicase